MIILLLVIGTPHSVSAQTLQLSGNQFYFHYATEIYHNQNSSAILLDEANLTAPSGSTPRILEVSAAIRNATTIFGSIWVGSAAWITRTLTETATIQGTVTFTVWLSSDDAPPSYSGVGAGVTILDAMNQTVGGYVYAYSYASGPILTSTPTAHNFDVELNREVSAGQRLVFAVGVGSTTEGWRMKVFFDDAQHPSHAELPSNVTVLPEFPMIPTVALAFAASVLSLTVAKRRSPPCTGKCVETFFIHAWQCPFCGLSRVVRMSKESPSDRLNSASVGQ